MDSDVECDIWLQTMNILMQTTFCFYAKSNNSPDRSIWVIQWVIFSVILQQNFSRISSNNNFLIWHWNINSQLQTKSIKKRYIIQVVEGIEYNAVVSAFYFGMFRNS